MKFFMPNKRVAKIEGAFDNVFLMMPAFFRLEILVFRRHSSRNTPYILATLDNNFRFLTTSGNNKQHHLYKKRCFAKVAHLRHLLEKEKTFCEKSKGEKAIPNSRKRNIPITAQPFFDVYIRDAIFRHIVFVKRENIFRGLIFYGRKSAEFPFDNLFISQ